MRIIGLVVLLLLAPLATAQEGTVYLDEALNSEIEGEFLGCVNTPRYAMEADVGTDAKAYFYEVPSGGGQVGCRIYFDHTVAYPSALEGDATLTIYVACDIGAPGAPASSAFRGMLFHNGEELARQAGGSIAVCDDSVVEVSFKLATNDVSLAVGDTLSVAVVSWVSNLPPPANENLHVRVGPAFPSALTAVGLATTAPAIVTPEPSVDRFFRFETIEGHSSVAGNTTGVQTGQWAYNWTATTEQATLDLNLTPIEGNMTFTAVREGVEIINQTTAEALVIQETLNATGNWTFAVAVDAADGAFNLTLVPFVAGSEPASSGPAGMDDPASEGESETTDGEPAPSDTPEDEDSPGFGILGLLVLVGAALLARRR